MNARAEHLESPSRPVVARAEHISLESAPDVVATPLRHPHRKTLSTFKVDSRLRGSASEISILDDHYLSVRHQLSGQEPSKYVLDLRFANPRPVIVRRVAWVCLGLSLALLFGSAAAFWWTASGAAPLWTQPGFFAGIGGLIASATGAFFFLRRTTESLRFTSVHGEATLVNITGGIGSAKAGRKFFVDVIKNISAAKLARPQAKQLFLRDEMREHHRLRELNVLSQEEYEASKARILRAHS
ncbi:MAG TPA: hypothetical protein VIT67_16380 [Povalibacter sp.]